MNFGKMQNFSKKIFYDLLKKHLQFTVYCGIILLGCERLV